MYIESKLKEAGETLFSLNVSEIEPSEIVAQEICKSSPLWYEAKSKIQFTKGLFTVDSYFLNEKNLTDIFTVRGEYIQVSYLGKGNSLLILPKEKQAIGLGRIYCCYDRDTINTIKMPASNPTHYQAIFLSKEYYLELLEHETWAKNSSFYKKVIQGDHQEFGDCKFPIVYTLFHTLNQIIQGDWEKEFKKYFIDLKLKELFLGLHQSQQESAQALGKGINEENLDKIRTAHAYLIENFKSPPTIKELARKVLLNEFQLKKDFKEMYGKTIRSFIIELRMEKAKSLLGKHTVSEMAGILGYKSVPHFISTYKKCYGHTPKQGLNQ